MPLNILQTDKNKLSLNIRYRTHLQKGRVSIPFPLYAYHTSCSCLHYIIVGPNDCQSVVDKKLGFLCSSPLIFEAGTVKAQDSADKYEEWKEFDPHSRCLNQMSVPKDNGNGYAPHSWCSSQKFSSIYPPAI